MGARAGGLNGDSDLPISKLHGMNDQHKELDPVTKALLDALKQSGREEVRPRKRDEYDEDQIQALGTEYEIRPAGGAARRGVTASV